LCRHSKSPWHRVSCQEEAVLRRGVAAPRNVSQKLDLRAVGSTVERQSMILKE